MHRRLSVIHSLAKERRVVEACFSCNIAVIITFER